MSTRPRIAVIDDTQRVALASADWDTLDDRAETVFFRAPFTDEADAAAQLQSFQVIVPMRERTAFSASLLGQLPNLRLIALTGARAPIQLDVAWASCAGSAVALGRVEMGQFKPQRVIVG